MPAWLQAEMCKDSTCREQKSMPSLHLYRHSLEEMCTPTKNGEAPSIKRKTGLGDLKTKKATRKSPFFVRMRRFELPHPNGHHPLKVACLPISPHARLGIAKVENQALGSKASLRLSLLFLLLSQKLSFQRIEAYCKARQQWSLDLPHLVQA